MFSQDSRRWFLLELIRVCIIISNAFLLLFRFRLKALNLINIAQISEQIHWIIVKQKNMTIYVYRVGNYTLFQQ